MGLIKAGFSADIILGSKLPITMHQSPEPFTTEWTVAGDAAARTITLPLVESRAEGALAYDCVVDWGDGTTPSLVTSYNDANRIYTYPSDGTYVVKIYGVMEGWSFNNGGDKLKITKVIHWGDSQAFEGFKYLNAGFYGCSNLTDIGTSPISASGTGVLSQGFQNTFRDTGFSSISNVLFSKHLLTETFASCFRGSALTALPAGALDNNTAVTSLYQFCTNASAFTTVADGLLDKLTSVTNMQAMFQNTALSAIPNNFLDYNTLVTNLATAFDDTSITELPVDLLKYLVNLTDTSEAFRDTDIATIPNGFLDYNTALIDVSQMFRGCLSLATSPANLCRNNTSITNFSQMFLGCIKHQQNADIFYAAGEQSTRFLNQSPDFTQCFERSSFTGTQGTAPDLWDCDFGTGTPTTTDCWNGAGNSASSLTNYASIPAGWK